MKLEITQVTQWEMNEALNFIRQWQPVAKQFGYHLCLGGGVLNNGRSMKDLDIMVLPLGNVEERKVQMIQFLETFGLLLRKLPGMGYEDFVDGIKEVYGLLYGERQQPIDFFFYNVHKIS